MGTLSTSCIRMKRTQLRNIEMIKETDFHVSRCEGSTRGPAVPASACQPAVSGSTAQITWVCLGFCVLGFFFAKQIHQNVASLHQCLGEEQKAAG